MRARDVEQRPLWAQVALSALFTFVLFAFGGAAAFVGGAASDAPGGAAFGVVIAFLVVVPFLVYYAYPPETRQWYHYAAFGLCVVGGFTLPIPLVYLPWRIVSRRAWAG
jgi:threonine/homoserine efflux transporter RhtA